MVVVLGVAAGSSRLLHADTSAATAHRETRSFVLIGAPGGCGKRPPSYAPILAQAVGVAMPFAESMSYLVPAQLLHLK